MPVSKGIDVQKSRFAALALETSSESEEELAGREWQTVKQKAAGGKQGAQKKGGAHSTGQEGEENRPLSKNAKKRARKKRQQQQAQIASETASSGGEYKGPGVEPGQPLMGEEPVWQKKNQEVMEKEFQKDLEQAILLSKLEAEKQDKLEEHLHAAEHFLKATTKPSNKKKVTLSLQQLHMEKVPTKTDTGLHLSDNSDPTLSPVDPQFFSRLGQDVKTELKREKELERRIDDGRQPQSPSSFADDLPRIAQLQNEIEKRDKTLLHCKKENEALKKVLKEVKERNQSLCMIMSQGEISSKAKLLQQIQDLTTVKNELTSEIETLHASLEQERSKNKALKSELAKLQGMKGAKSS